MKKAFLFPLMSLIFASVSSFAIPYPPELPEEQPTTGTLTASSNVCYIKPGNYTCSSDITWTSHGSNNVQVTVNGALFASGKRGTSEAPWISENPAVFQLWVGDEMIKQIVVLGSHKQPVENAPYGKLAATPCALNGNAVCTSQIYWNTENANEVQVRVNGFLFAGAITGVGVEAPWISANPLTFELWAEGVLLDSIVVKGTL